MIRYFFSLFVFILLFNHPVNLQSQDNFRPGYITSSAGDTLIGAIEHLEWQTTPGKIAFLEDSGSVPVVYTPETISSFGFSGNIYRSWKVDITDMPKSEINAQYGPLPVTVNQTVFLRLLFEGELSLYQFKDARDINHFYIRIPGELPVELIFFKYREAENGQRIIRTNTKYKGQLLYYLHSCNVMQDEINQTKYEADDLIALLNAYSRCKKVQPTYTAELDDPLTAQRKRKRIKMGIYAGVSFSKLDFKGNTGLPYLDNASFPPSLNPAAGMMLLIEPARSKGRWAIVTDILFRSYSISTTAHFDYSEAWHKDYDVDLKSTYITFNPMWRSYFGDQANIRPYVNAGIYIASRIRNVNTLTIHEDYYGNTSTKTARVSDSNPVDFGVSAGTGLFVGKFNIDIRYTFGGFNAYEEKSTLQFLGLMLGYRFN